MARFRSTGDPTLDVGILAASIVIVLLVRLCIQHWPKMIYCLAPRKTEFARVQYVRATPYAWNRRNGEETAHIHTAGFVFSDGRKIKLHITHEDYIMLRVGSEGYLTRKGGWFLGFERNRANGGC